MYQKMTIEQVEKLVGQLALQELVQLLKYISERLSQALPIVPEDKEEKGQTQQARLLLAKELLAEVDDIADDAQGESGAVQMIRQMRDERVAQLCQKDA
jgi:hypothetical protein